MKPLQDTSDDTRMQLDADYWEKVRQARLMSGEEKVLAGFRLFEIECEQLRASLRASYPWASEPLITKYLRDHLDADRPNVYFDRPIFVDATTTE